MRQPGGHRADIDGLRAFAVLLVVIFHINEALIPGGFIGVDMFFVISGFLITGNIVRDREAGRFSYAEFYRRRIKRIFPAMFLVTGVTLLLGLALLLPEDVETLSWSALATALSGANVYFTWFLDTSYFAADSRTVPLLHMWSLGVEEQFYLIWPALILALIPLRRAIMPVLAILIVASIAFGQWLLSHDQFQLAYYMLPSRLFQLAAGGLIVLLLRSAPVAKILDRTALPTFALGAATVGWSAVVLTGETPFPGLNAVPVTFGTVLLLAAGTRQNLLSRAISVQPLRHIGEISYSLYLWHWPVLAFQRYFYGELSPMQQATSFAAMLVLSELSHRLVETPLRQTKEPFFPIFVMQFVLPLAVVVSAVAGIVGTKGYGPWIWTDYPARVAAIQKTLPQPANASPKVCQGFPLTATMLQRKTCVIGKGNPTVLLYGDSNASHFIGVISSLAKKNQFTFRNFSHAACPPIFGDPTAFAGRKQLAPCKVSLDLIRDRLAGYDTIIVGAAWSDYAANGKINGASFEKAVKDFVSTVTARGTKIVLMAKIPVNAKYRLECAGKNTPGCQSRKVSARQADPFTAVLRDIAKSNSLVKVADVSDVLCIKKTCFSYWYDEPLYFNTSHLSLSGSYFVGGKYALTKEGRDIGRFIASSHWGD